MNIKPLFDRVIVIDLIKEKTETGIILPGQPDMLMKGRVVEVGDGHWEFGNFIETKVKTGDIVYYLSAGKYEIKESGIKYRIIRETEIFAKEENLPDNKE